MDSYNTEQNLRLVADAVTHWLQEEEEEEGDDSEAEASDIDEDAEAKAERLGQHMAAGAAAPSASASGRPRAAARTSMKRANPSPVEVLSSVGKPKSNKKSKKGLQLSEMADGQMQKGEVLQQSKTAAGLAEDGQGEGYEPYRRDILAEVARKQREHLLGAKIGATIGFLLQAFYNSAYFTLTLLSSSQI